jgi:hypothetical protein
MSDAAFRLMGANPDRAPTRIELVIPAGAAEQVAKGESPPSIPTDLKLMVGDTLIVKNEDGVDHQLGPVWAPPGASASLVLAEANNFAYACTFQPSRYLGLDVQAPVTLLTRVQALFLAGPPMGALIAIYSIAIWPVGAAPKLKTATA